MNGVEREQLRRQIDAAIRASAAFKNVCAECLEPLKTPATSRKKFCSRRCNSNYYWARTRARRHNPSGSYQDEPSEAQGNPVVGTARRSPDTDTPLLSKAPNTFEAAA